MKVSWLVLFYVICYFTTQQPPGHITFLKQDYELCNFTVLSCLSASLGNVSRGTIGGDTCLEEFGSVCQ